MIRVTATHRFDRPTLSVRALLACGTALITLALTADATEQHPSTLPAGRGAYVFGDSSSEMGNLYLTPGLVGAAFPTSYIANGWTRESNGPIWNELLAPGMRPVNAGGPYGNRVNFAHSNATTGMGNITVTDLNEYDYGVLRQLGRFQGLLAARQISVQPGDLFFINAGPNDLMNALFAEEGDPAATVASLVSNLTGTSRNLFQAGAKHVFVWDIPHIEQAPQFNSSTIPPQAQAGLAQIRGAMKALSDTARTALDTGLSQVAVPADASLVTVRLSKLQEHLSSNAKQLGFTRPATEGCIDIYAETVCSSDRAVQNQFLFIDNLHLTAPAQAYEAAYYATLVDQVLGGVNRRAARLSDIGIDAGRLAADLGQAGMAGADGKRQGFGLFADSGWRRRDAGGDGALAQQTVKAAIAGMSYADHDGWRIALGGGPLEGTGRFQAGGGFDLTGAIASVQVTNNIGRLQLRSSLGHAWFDLDRITRPGGIPTLTPRGDSQGEASSYAFTAAWHVDMGDLFIEPGLGFGLDEASVKSYAERNGAGLEMKIDRMKRSDWTATASLKAGFRPVNLSPNIRLSGQVEASYTRHLDRPGTATLADLIDNTARPVSLFVGDGPRDRVSVAPTLSLSGGDSTTLSVSYATQIRGDKGDAVRAGLAWRF
ncbi:hypothetical protein CHU95_01920 [Niveispirillum lacus]|uniref:Autotransporter domain-containing protein n=1 Tax=Niveispirillum lacus TaxID=1981099 RepID=A0A255Z6X6_9PROT|nr:SGNH/GDSL hydrolase family protein [Niveispirillum lacus]OYQ37293.1 hypothetical protein CHU95_01920 [Niveispirillum lacus]